MKFGMRTPSISKSFSARTSGRAKRAIKGSINPVYGKKGMGWVNNPKRAAYNKVYNKTTVSAQDIVNDNNLYTDTNKVSIGEILGGIFNLIYGLILLVAGLIQVIVAGAMLIGLIYIIYLIFTL